MENAPKVEGTSSGASVLDGELGAWLPIETAPHDNTLLLLLVEPDDHATEDAALCRTIGGNNRDNDGEDRWQFAGWCWTHDHFTEGTGKVLGWLPMPDAPNTTLIEAKRAIRGIVNCHDEEVLELLRAILARTSPRTATGSAVLDACQAVEDSISDRYLREAEEAYQASPCYRQDRRNDAISKGG